MKNVVFWDLGTPRCCKTDLFLDYTVFNTVVKKGRDPFSNDAGQLKRYRDTGLLSEVFRNPANLDKLTGTERLAMFAMRQLGKLRWITSSPSSFRFHDTQFGLAHNGNLTNAKSLKRELENNGAIFSSTSDSEILAHLICRSHNPSFMGKVKEALNTVKVDLLTFSCWKIS